MTLVLKNTDKMPLPDCEICALWLYEQQHALWAYLCNVEFAPETNQISNSMCCSECGCYNIFVSNKDSDWKLTVYRSVSKFSLTSICYLLNIPVEQEYAQYNP